MSAPKASISEDKRYKIQAAAFLGLVGGISALFGFSSTLGKVKKSKSKLIAQNHLYYWTRVVGSGLPKIKSNDHPTSRTDFQSLTELMKYLAAWSKG